MRMGVQPTRGAYLVLMLVSWVSLITCFHSTSLPTRRLLGVTSFETTEKPKDNNAMSFLKKIGRVGGTANRDFRYAVGIDEGPSGKSLGSGHSLKKAPTAFQSCVATGVIDDMSEDFPVTSSGTQWAGYTDRVMGGMSTGSLGREDFEGRVANVLRGHVSMANNGGFVQMATNLAINKSEGVATVDASQYGGVEVDVFSRADKTEKFCVHLKTPQCTQPFSSYRASFLAPPGVWETFRVPFENFKGKGPGAVDAEFDLTSLARAGIVALGREMDVVLAVSGFRFYRKEAN